MTGRSGSERGQVLMLVTLVLVILFGIAALVFDLGMSWMLRRQEQNAADPASLAAARFISDPDPITGLQTYDPIKGWNAACRYARMNGFFEPSNTSCDASADPSGTSMTVNWPPRGSVDDYWVGDRGHVEVLISSTHDSFFARIFGQDVARVETGAVAARQRGNTNSHSLIALKPEGCNTARVRGNSTITIYPAPGYTGPGGFVQVNSECGNSTADDDCSTSSQGSLNINGGAVLTAPKVNVHGGCSGHSSQPAGPLDEAAVQIGDPLSGLEFPAWDTSVPGGRCGVSSPPTTAAASQGCGQGGGHLPWKKSADSACPGLPSGHDCIELDPGIYYGGWSIGSKVRVTLKPGIYVIAGGGITIGSSGSLDSLGGTAAPAPILIYNTDNPLHAATCPGSATRCQAAIDLTAQASLKLAGLLASQPCPPVTVSGGCPYGGMVIWYDGDGSQSATKSGLVDIEGGAVLSISGTIYAPDAHVDITGNVDTNCGPTSTQIAAVQIISWTWDIGGTGDLCMPYNPDKLFKLTQQGLID